MRWRSAACALLSGCTFVFASGPPAHVERGQRVECDETYWAPIADTVIAPAAAATGVAIIYAGTHSSCTSTQPGGCAFSDLANGFAAEMGGLLAFGIAAVYAVSAYRGYRDIDPEKCHQAKLDAANF